MLLHVVGGKRVTAVYADGQYLQPRALRFVPEFLDVGILTRAKWAPGGPIFNDDRLAIEMPLWKGFSIQKVDFRKRHMIANLDNGLRRRRKRDAGCQPDSHQQRGES